jgi:hypothetical protein
MSEKYVIKTLVLTSFILFSVSLRAFDVKEFYFLEDDQKNQKIIYKSICITKDGTSTCNLKHISISNSKSSLKCGISSGELMSWTKAGRSGSAYTISSTAGACGYTNTYTISKSGMVQLKIAPDKPKNEFCGTFPPKTYKMKYLKSVANLKVDTSGCDEMQVLSID